MKHNLPKVCLVPILFLLLIYLTGTSGSTLEVESAVIKCTQENDDEKVINWKPKPLTSFNEEIAPGPHEPDSDLKLDLENDIDLKLEKITGCKRKMVVTLKLTNKGIESDDGSLIKVDHVLDEETGHSSRVGQPIAIKLQQGPMFKAYKLHYITAVNAGPREEVINYMNTKDFKGCNDGDKTPTCGFQKNEQSGEIILSSRGFCCDCDKAEQDTNGKQIRGGQTCIANANNTETAYYASAHCLKYNDYWYGMYDLGKTEIFHPVYVEAYQSIELENGTVVWEQIGGNDSLAKIDSLQTKEYKKEDKIAVIYRKFESRNLVKGNLDPMNNFLLIPKPFLVKNTSGGANIPSYASYPAEFHGDIGDTYLIIPKTSVDQSGTQCDKVGVDHIGFRSQGKPCVQKQGSCLKNQPFQLWKGDSASSASNSKYRFKHYGTPHKASPFKMIQGNLYLIMEHEDEVSAYIDIEISADHLDMAKPGYNAAIVSVSGESSSTAGKLFVVVANNEAVGSYYSVHLLQCTEGIPLQKTEKRLIDARNTEEFQVDIKHYPHVLSTDAKCSVGVININNEVIAIRKAILSPGDTCFCSVICSCVCAKESIECIELPLGERKAAGLDEEQLYESHTDNEFVELAGNHLEYSIPILILILLILGLCKGLIGRCCSRKIGICGLGVFHERPKKLKQYFEREYSQSEVIYDEEGNPLDPFTKKPTVQRLSSTEELTLNSVFFLCCPLFFVWTLIRCCCNCIKPNKSKSPSQSNHDFEIGSPSEVFSDSKFRTRKTSLMESSKKSVMVRNASSMPNQTSTITRVQPESRPQVRSMPLVESKYKSNENVDNKKSPVSSRKISGTSRTYGSWHRQPENVSGSDAGRTTSATSKISGLSTKNSQDQEYEYNEYGEE